MVDISGYLTDKPCSGTPPYDHLVNANLYNPVQFYPVNKAAGSGKWHLENRKLGMTVTKKLEIYRNSYPKIGKK